MPILTESQRAQLLKLDSDGAIEAAFAMGVEACSAQLQQQVAALEAEEEESMAVIGKLSRILAEIAVVLKGPEAHLHRHGYQDLVELTTVNVLEVQLSRVRIEELEADRESLVRKALEAAAEWHSKKAAANDDAGRTIQAAFHASAAVNIRAIDHSTITNEASNVIAHDESTTEGFSAAREKEVSDCITSKACLHPEECRAAQCCIPF